MLGLLRSNVEFADACFTRCLLSELLVLLRKCYPSCRGVLCHRLCCHLPFAVKAFVHSFIHTLLYTSSLSHALLARPSSICSNLTATPETHQDQCSVFHPAKCNSLECRQSLPVTFGECHPDNTNFVEARSTCRWLGSRDFIPLFLLKVSTCNFS